MSMFNMIINAEVTRRVLAANTAESPRKQQNSYQGEEYSKEYSPESPHEENLSEIFKERRSLVAHVAEKFLRERISESGRVGEGYEQEINDAVEMLSGKNGILSHYDWDNMVIEENIERTADVIEREVDNVITKFEVFKKENVNQEGPVVTERLSNEIGEELKKVAELKQKEIGEKERVATKLGNQDDATVTERLSNEIGEELKKVAESKQVEKEKGIQERTATKLAREANDAEEIARLQAEIKGTVGQGEK